MKKPYGYFTTGEFARICRVNKQTLFHYDKIGILSPELTGDNGYRYYSYLQLDTFNAISILKDLDMPLSDIKKFLDNRTPEDFLNLLEEQSSLVDRKIELLKWVKKFISQRIDTTKEGIGASHGRIFMEEYPEVRYIISEHHGGTDDPGIYASLAEHMTYNMDHSIYSYYAIGGLVDTEEGPWKDSYRYSHFFSRLTPGETAQAENIVQIPAHTRLCIYSTSGFKPVPDMLNQLLEYAVKHNFKITKYFFEELLLDDMSQFGFDSFVLKLSIPIIED